MSPTRERYQTLDEQERARMRELLDLISAAPDASASAPIHEKIGALAELQLLIGAHNANGSRFIREIVVGELDQLRADMHAIYDPLSIVIDRVSQRLDAMDTRQNTMDTRITSLEASRKAADDAARALTERQDRLEIRTRINTAMVIVAILADLVVTMGLHLLTR